MKPSTYVASRCREARVSLAALQGDSQRRELTRLRQEIALVLRERFALRLVDVARLIGRRSHADATYAIRQARKRRGQRLRGGGVGIRPR